MAIRLWSSTNRLSPFGRDLVDLFDDLFEPETVLPIVSRSDTFSPPVESYVADKELHLRAELPGIDSKDVNVSLNDGHLCISGERKRMSTGEGTCVCLDEVEYGTFSRCFHVPRGVNPDKIQARYENGILDVTVPLPESVAGKMIPIETGEGGKKAIST